MRERNRRPMFGILVVACVGFMFACPSQVIQAGSIEAWGTNIYGLQDDVPTITDAKAISAGNEHCLVLRSDGSITGWGDDRFHQLTDAPTGTGYKAIAGTAYSSFAIASDGSIAAWGSDDQSIVSDTPTGTGFTAIDGYRHCIALREDGSVVTWGRDDYGEVTNTPTDKDFIAVAAGAYHSLALRSDGSLEAWGWDSYGQISDLPTESGFVAIAAGDEHDMALRADGSIVMWGRDDHNQVSGRPLGTGHTAIAGGAYHSLAITADGSVEAWGRNSEGEVSGKPSAPGHTAVAAGGAFSAALSPPPPTLPKWPIDWKDAKEALRLLLAARLPFAIHDTILGLKLSIPPPHTIGLPFLGLELVEVGAHYVLHHILEDPPDPYFAVPVQPVFPAMPTPPNDGSMPESVYVALLELQDTGRDILSYEQAILAALEKHAGAVAAGDYGWAQTHAQELEPWGPILADLYTESAERKESLADQIVATGFAVDPIDDADIASLRSLLLSSGLPQPERDILALYGYGTDMEQEIIDLHLSFEDDDIPRDLITALRGSAEIDRQLGALLAIPEPTTLCALGLAVAGLGGYIRKRRRN